MSAADEIPYQLRPNKFIDRELFLELLSRVMHAFGAENYAYISMGGPHLVDHRMVYRRIGIDALYSFADSDDVVDRQKCNRPNDKIKCVVKSSSEVAQSLGSILDDFERKQAIVWFDYTSGWARKSQIEELVRVSQDLTHGDVIKITMNANIQNLAKVEEWKEEALLKSEKEGDGEIEGGEDGDELSSFPAYCRKKLEEHLQEYCPSQPELIDGRNFPETLFSAIRIALDEAAGGEKVFNTILVSKYRDGQTMMSATFLCQKPDEELPLSIKEWQFLSMDWVNSISIESPNLSMRERFLIDDQLSSKPEDIVDKVGFFPKSDKKGSKSQVQSYQRLHRFYPTFLNIDTA